MKPTYHEWLQTIPTNLRDEACAVLDGTTTILDYLEIAYQYGRDSREVDLEAYRKVVRENEARIDGYKTALQDKIQIHHNVINVSKKRWWQK